MRVVEYVENKINKIKSRMNELDSQKLGLLTSINIAQDLFFLKKENEKLSADTRQDRYIVGA